jgi:hypothetical protein
MQSSDKKSKNQSETLDNDGVSKDVLWEEIYKNAVSDREKASMLITNLWKEITSDPEKHVLFGTAMSKYLERMSKSNDQLIKLAELVQKNNEDEDVDVIDTENLYTKISAGDD